MSVNKLILGDNLEILSGERYCGNEKLRKI